MIGFLRGDIAELSETCVMLDVNGVGYRVNVPTSVRAGVNLGDEDVKLHTTLIVSDGAMDLYGFLTAEERDIFETVITVSGIGPKVGVKLLSVQRDRLVDAIQNGDIAVLTTVPGVGKKIAERVCLELRDKITKGFGSLPPRIAPGVFAEGEVGIAVQGLQTLGFSGAEIREFLKGVKSSELEKMTAQQIITLCLKKRK